MNIIISYIEEHILEEINIKELSKLTGLNETIIKSVFPCLVGYGIKEYIRKRRLTLCIDDLKQKRKVLDVALKYGYNSTNAFTRAFKAFHNITPSEVTQDNKNLKLFNKIKFNEEIENNYLTYTISYNKKIILYGISSNEFKTNEIPRNTRSFWKEIKEKYHIFNECDKRYGFLRHLNDSSAKYYCCLDKKQKDFEKIEFNKSDYFIVKIYSFSSKDISNNIKKILKNYIKSANFTYKDKEVIEVYYKDYIELLIPIS